MPSAHDRYPVAASDRGCGSRVPESRCTGQTMRLRSLLSDFRQCPRHRTSGAEAWRRDGGCFGTTASRSSLRRAHDPEHIQSNLSSGSVSRKGPPPETAQGTESGQGAFPWHRLHDQNRPLWAAAQLGGGTLAMRLLIGRRTRHFDLSHRTQAGVSDDRLDWGAGVGAGAMHPCRYLGPDPASGARPQPAHSLSGSWKKNPERGLGSNHVDFGGITAPASATATSSSMLVG